MRGLRRLELERGADVHGLAVPPLVLQRRQAITVDLVADSASQGDAPRKRIGAPDIDRIIVAPAKRWKSLAVAPVRADGDTAGWFEYADAAADAIGDRADVVLVAVWTGGLTAPIVSPGASSAFSSCASR